MMFKLALVTGASSGIGRGVCELLAEKKVPLIACGRNLNELEKLKRSLERKIPIRIFQADLAINADRQSLIKIIHEQQPDLVINNAGFGLYGDALTYTTTEQLEILEVNGMALLELTLEAARTLMSVDSKGVILNVSSAAAFQVLPTLAVYAASKSFVNHFSEAFDFEVKSSGIRVLTFCPGMVKTSFSKRANGEKQANEPLAGMEVQEVVEKIWDQIKNCQRLKIVNWTYQIFTFASFFLTKSWIAKQFKKVINKRIKFREIIKIKNESR